jgi:hypothetical protein
MADSKPKLTFEHLQFIKDGVAFIQQEEPSVYEEARTVPYDRLFAILGDDFGWSYLYECSLKETAIFYYSVLGLIPTIQERLSQGVEVNKAIMDVASQAEKYTSDMFEAAFAGCSEKPTIEELRAVRFGLGNMFDFSDLFAVTYALLGHMAALRKFGKDMSQLVEDVRNGKDESFFHAVRIDPTVLACVPFVKRMSVAQLQADSRFIGLVGNALKVKWKKPKVDLDSLRVILHGLNDSGQLDDLSQNDADLLLIQKLQVYSDAGDDPARSLYRFIQRWKEKK